MEVGIRENNGKTKIVGILLAVVVLLGLHGLAWAAAEGGHGAGGLNWKDFLFRLLNFSIMAGILYKLLKKPLTNFFTSRRENIQKTLAELEVKKQEAEKKCQEYKAKLAALEGETQKIVSEYIQEGELEKQKILEAAERQAEYIKEQAQLAIQQEMKAARDTLQREVAEMSVGAAEQILRKKMKAKDQDRLVRDFMTKVVEAK